MVPAVKQHCVGGAFLDEWKNELWGLYINHEDKQINVKRTAAGCLNPASEWVQRNGEARIDVEVLKIGRDQNIPIVGRRDSPNDIRRREKQVREQTNTDNVSG